MPIPLLITVELTRENLSLIEHSGFEIFIIMDMQKRNHFLKEKGQNIRAVLTNGSTGLTEYEISKLPKLEIICALGAGYENINLAAARRRGITIPKKLQGAGCTF